VTFLINGISPNTLPQHWFCISLYCSDFTLTLFHTGRSLDHRNPTGAQRAASARSGVLIVCCSDCTPASFPYASAFFTHYNTLSLDSFCRPTAGKSSSPAGLFLPLVYAYVVDCAPASPYAYSSSTHRFPDERTPIEATPLSATSAELGLGLGLGLGWDSLSRFFLHALPFFLPPSFHTLDKKPNFNVPHLTKIWSLGHGPRAPSSRIHIPCSRDTYWTCSRPLQMPLSPPCSASLPFVRSTTVASCPVPQVGISRVSCEWGPTCSQGPPMPSYFC